MPSPDQVQLAGKFVYGRIDGLEMPFEVGELLFGESIQELLLQRIQISNDATDQRGWKKIRASVGDTVNEVTVDVETLHIPFFCCSRHDQLVAGLLLELLA